MAERRKEVAWRASVEIALELTIVGLLLMAIAIVVRGWRSRVDFALAVVGFSQAALLGNLLRGDPQAAVGETVAVVVAAVMGLRIVGPKKAGGSKARLDVLSPTERGLWRLRNGAGFSAFGLSLLALISWISEVGSTRLAVGLTSLSLAFLLVDLALSRRLNKGVRAWLRPRAPWGL